MTIPFPVPSGVTPWCCTWDDTGTVVCTSACAPWVSTVAERSCLHSRASKDGRYFGLLELRGNMECPLGVCPDRARTIPDLQRRTDDYVPGLGWQPRECYRTPARCDEFGLLRVEAAFGRRSAYGVVWVGRRIISQDRWLGAIRTVTGLTPCRLISRDLAPNSSAMS
jgi:hypothetical protein